MRTLDPIGMKNHCQMKNKDLLMMQTLMIIPNQLIDNNVKQVTANFLGEQNCQERIIESLRSEKYYHDVRPSDKIYRVSHAGKKWKEKRQVFME